MEFLLVGKEVELAEKLEEESKLGKSSKIIVDHNIYLYTSSYFNISFYMPL